MGNWFLSLLSTSWAADLRDDLKIFLLALFAITGVLATGYSVYLGFLLAKAKDENERKTAKKRIFSTVAGLVIIVLLTISFVGLDLSGFPDFDRQQQNGGGNTNVIPRPPIEPDIGDNTQPPGDDDDEDPPYIPGVYQNTPKINNSHYDFAYPLNLDSYDETSFNNAVIKEYDENTHIGVDISGDWYRDSVFSVHSIADGTVTKMIKDDPDWGNYLVVRHDKTIHSHNVHKRTISRTTGPSITRGPAPNLPTLGDREVRSESGWIVDTTMGEGGKTLVETDVLLGMDSYIWHWKYEVGREVWQYVHTIYMNLHPDSFRESAFSLNDHVEAGQFIGLAYTDAKTNVVEGEESNALHIEMVLYGDDLYDPPSPNSITEDEGRVDFMLYTKSGKVAAPVPSFSRYHWKDGNK